MFLHANLFHIIVNVLVLLILGFRIEPTVGGWKTFAVFLGSGFGGVLFSSLVSPHELAVGASTAIIGLNTAMIAWILMNWDNLLGNPYRAVTLV